MQCCCISFPNIPTSVHPYIPSRFLGYIENRPFGLCGEDKIIMAMGKRFCQQTCYLLPSIYICQGGYMWAWIIFTFYCLSPPRRQLTCSHWIICQWNYSPFRCIHTKGCFRDKFQRHELEKDIYRCRPLIHVSEICLWNSLRVDAPLQ